MAHHLRDLKFSRATLVPDAMAGLTVALVSIPEGMAYALVAGVNPVYGLYTGMVTTIVASLTVSTSLMLVTLIKALAVVTADQLGALGSDVDPVRAMFTLTLLTGAVMFALGLLRLGSVIRFVSREVMSGFVFAAALLIVTQQDQLRQEPRPKSRWPDFLVPYSPLTLPAAPSPPRPRSHPAS